MKMFRALATFLFALTALVGATVGSQPSAVAADNPYERGPDPTESSIEAPRGSFSTSDDTVPRAAVSGFGGGTIYYPTDSSQTYGGVAIAPGYTASQSSMAWFGPRLASQGFVVFTIDTLTTSDQPSSRARQLKAALTYLTTQSSQKSLVDPERLGMMGHSMGGGGTLEAAAADPSLKAAIPLTPWDTTKNFSGITTPTLIVGAQNDSVASVRSHAEPFYESIPESTSKAYLELRGASHFAPNTSNTTIAKYSISWLKRFIDDDTRYDQFLCPAPGTDLDISQYESTCPYA